jgi:Ca-activated chloride channel family protein
VESPAGLAVERVEFYRGEELVAALYQEPWVQPIDLGETASVFLRVVAYLEDGSSTEDLVLLAASEFGETVEVRLVEVYATVLDGKGLPVHDLQPSEFRVFESEREQQVLRWERLEDLPLYAALLIDTSASMADYLSSVREMAQRFLAEALRPRDRAAVITFSEQPRLAAGFTGELDPLVGALAGLHPEQGTALWDSLVFAVYHLRDLQGQRALIVLSDGADQRSEYGFDEALRYTTASGVAVYVVALEESARGEARDRLRQLAETTGGRSFFLADIGELAAVYAAIQEDLRSRYLLVYQAPPATDALFRPIRVEVSRPGHETRALQGYYP